jgi:general secretion pathway protein M
MSIQLSRRDKKSLVILSGFLIVYSLFHFIIHPVVSKKSRMEKALIKKSGELEEIMKLKAEHQSLKASSALSDGDIRRRKEHFTLFSYLEEISGKAGVKENISYMKPSSSEQKNTAHKLSVVEMKLQAVPLDKLAGFLYQVETTEKSVSVTKIAITKENKDGTLSAVLQIETVET